jgi:hypothetical protein
MSRCSFFFGKGLTHETDKESDPNSKQSSRGSAKAKTQPLHRATESTKKPFKLPG